MRILHVLPTRAPEYGGPIAVANALAAEASAAGASATLFPPEEVRPRGLLYWPGARVVRSLGDAVRGADLIHVHGLWTALATAAASAACAQRKPYVVTPHGMLDRWSMAQGRWRKRLYLAAIERRNLARAAAVHFLNEGEFEEASAILRFPAAFVVPNGVELETPPARTFRGSGRIEVLFLGRLHPKKGIELLVRAVGACARRGVEIGLTIAGPDEGGHRAEIEALIAELGLQERCRLVGPAFGAAKRACLAAADLFALPSSQEGDSVAVKEALASGLPVLISPQCRLPVVERENAGRVVPADVDSITGALAVLADGRTDLAAMGANARRLAESAFRWPLIGQRMLAIYRDVLDGTRDAPGWIRTG